jgi:hypothetical protein
MRSFVAFFLLASTSCVLACSGSGGGSALDAAGLSEAGPAEVGRPEPDDTDPDQPDVSSPDDAPPSGLDVATFCNNAVTKAPPCAGTVLPTECEAAVREAEKRGCARFLPALAEYVVKSVEPFGCVADAPVLGNDAPELAVAGDACLGAVLRPNCYSVSCKSFRDCPTGSSCNETTGKCFENGATCHGLPCKTFRDCPSNARCNTALGLCIKS